MTRTNIINQLIQKRNYQSYLEIGIGSGLTYDYINCNIKIGVDPSDEYKGDILHITSDEFFKQNKNTFDIIFIDGLHISEQVIKDVNNSLKVLNNGGVIVLHDCNPPTEGHQIVPQQQAEWNGDVWKAILHFRTNLTGYEIFTIDTDYGCGIIQKGDSQYSIKYEVNPYLEMNYYYFTMKRKDILNLISVDEFNKLI